MRAIERLPAQIQEDAHLKRRLCYAHEKPAKIVALMMREVVRTSKRGSQRKRDILKEMLV